jgi:protein phosphatase 1L
MLPSHPTSGYCDIQGRRKVIEDFHTVHLYDSHQFFGVFDGHNGAVVAKYASATLYGHVMDFLGDIDTYAKNYSNWKYDIQKKLIEAFKVLHEGVIDLLQTYPVKYMSKSGTTATALLMTKDNIIIASVGDSRAVLSIGASFDGSSTSQSLQLTFDHIASDPAERERIESLGGFVSEKGGTLRVNGTLVLTRSIGDVHLDPYLSRIPSVYIMTKQEIQHKCQSKSRNDMPCFIILASDGLWDVFTNQEAVELVTSVLQKYGPQNWKEGGFQEAAEVLTQEAFVRGSGDNIGVCVVAIHE